MPPAVMLNLLFDFDVTDTIMRYTSLGLILGLFFAATFGSADLLVRTFGPRGKQAVKRGRDLE